MATPFDVDGRIDAPAIRSNVARWAAQGVGGVVALGSNGEAPLIDEDESVEVIEAARAALPSHLTLIAGTGRESTRATIAASRRAAALGASAVLVRTPSYYKGRMTADAFVRHYTAVADECPVPVLLYNFPAATGVNLTADAVARLSTHPNIAGMKETGSDTAQVAAFVEAARPSFVVIAGSAPTVYASLCMGARGAILGAACVIPELCVRLFAAYRQRDHETAREIQRRITPLAKLVTTEYGPPGLKAAMDAAGYTGGAPRMPLVAASEEAVERIRAELRKLGAMAEVDRVRS
jgi:4-hydroxy-2-oxoglutarate aldolase